MSVRHRIQTGLLARERFPASCLRREECGCSAVPNRRGRLDVERKSWLFARKANGHAAIWSQNGYETAGRGPYPGREIICRAESNAWIVEAGRKEDWSGFEQFVDAISRTEPDVADGTLEYSSAKSAWDGEAPYCWKVSRLHSTIP